MDDIGKMVKAARKEKGLSQKDLAGAMTVSQSYISQVENGKTQPTPMFVELLFLKFSIEKDTLSK